MTLYKEKRPNVIPMAARLLTVMILILFFILLIPAGVIAQESTKYSGIIRGAACTHYKIDCSEDDAHIAIENDFVLVLP